MKASEDVRDAFEEIAKGIVAGTDANSCLILFDITQGMIVEV